MLTSIVGMNSGSQPHWINIVAFDATKAPNRKELSKDISNTINVFAETSRSLSIAQMHFKISIGIVWTKEKS